MLGLTVYPNSLISINMCSDCETCGLLNRRGYQELCSDCKAYGLKKHGLTRSGCISLVDSAPVVGVWGRVSASVIYHITWP